MDKEIDKVSSVPLSRRKPSRFEAEHQYYKLRDAVTEFMLLDFGFSQEKYARKIERYRATHCGVENVDEVVARFKKKSDAFYDWYIDKECNAILKILQDIEAEFTFGNSIYPSETAAKLFEFIERRKHINAAIANCYILRQELQDIVRILPVDFNKCTRFTEAIDKQIALFKGVRQADNRFLRTKKRNELTNDIIQILNGIISVVSQMENRVTD